MALANTSSLLGRRSRAARVGASRSRSERATRAGESRSGSANTTSNAIATAPSSVRRRTMSATTVRGQGHCPTARMLASSMSTTTTGGCGSAGRGWIA